ncbi:MAG: MlaD family protein [Flavobacteriaceae bacterium]|nr:MlaD family protein [Flavobacteriaceae bacterium]
MKVSRELKTGIVALLIIALFIWGYNFMKNRSLYDKTRTFYAEYSNVQGLIPTSPVTINGLHVGKINKITFHPSKKGVLVAHIKLTNDVLFSKNSIAQIYSPDFISGKSLKIDIADDNADIAMDGDTLKGKVDSGILNMINEQIAPLQTKVESFVVNTDSVMKNLNAILDDQNKNNIKTSLKKLSQTLDKFNNIAANTDQIIENNDMKIESILDNADLAMQNFSQLTDSLQKADMGQTMLKLKASIESFSAIIESIENGEGTVGKLMQDEELYNNLEGASKELEELLREVKLHPKRFVHLSVFGKKEKPYEETTDK